MNFFWNKPRCLRCETVPLRVLKPRHPGIKFFECPECTRQYSRKSGKKLTFRWLHPISLVLYGIQFDKDPQSRVEEVVRMFVDQFAPHELALFASEIRLELQKPTQQVGDILDCQTSEQDLREFLRLFEERVTTFLS